MYIYSIVILNICVSLFESTLLSFCKPQSKLDLLTLRQGSREGKNAYIYICRIIRDNVTYESFRALDYLKTKHKNRA